MSLNSRLIAFRKKIRTNQKRIIDVLVEDHDANLCVFCGSTEKEEDSKEHIIPKWVYGRCAKKEFITNTNGSSVTYNKAVVHACKHCNSELLSRLEKHLKDEFNSTLATITF